MKQNKQGLRVASWNVLADRYTAFGDYSHAPARLMRRGVRIKPIIALLTRLQISLEVDVIGLQEVDEPLVEAIDKTCRWQTRWSQKLGAHDGCLMLVNPEIEIDRFETHHFNDGSGHVMQSLEVDNTLIENTHIKWDMPNRLAQGREFIDRAESAEHAVLIGDVNDRPDEPVRGMLTKSRYVSVYGDTPTAYIANREGPAAIDVFAVRGVSATAIAVEFGDDFNLSEIPSRRCPSDHTPLVAELG